MSDFQSGELPTFAELFDATDEVMFYSEDFYPGGGLYYYDAYSPETRAMDRLYSRVHDLSLDDAYGLLGSVREAVKDFKRGAKEFANLKPEDFYG